MSGPAVPGRFSFRFSRQPSCVTVDYTVQARAVEGRPQVKGFTPTRSAGLPRRGGGKVLVLMLIAFFCSCFTRQRHTVRPAL